jgi:hypothetical protein
LEGIPDLLDFRDGFPIPRRRITGCGLEGYVRTWMVEPQVTEVLDFEMCRQASGKPSLHTGKDE